MKKTSPSPPKKSRTFYPSHPLSWVWMATAPLHNQHRVGGLNAQNFFRRGDAPLGSRLEFFKWKVWWFRIHTRGGLHHASILIASMPQFIFKFYKSLPIFPPVFNSYSNFTSLCPSFLLCKLQFVQEIYLPTYTNKGHSKENNPGGSTPSSAFHQENTSQRTSSAVSTLCKIAKPLKFSKILLPPPSAISTWEHRFPSAQRS